MNDKENAVNDNHENKKLFDEQRAAEKEKQDKDPTYRIRSEKKL
jgi:hypothetical protein